MLIRLILLLMLVALGCQPAAASGCHDAPAMRMAMAAHPVAPAQHQHEAAAPHACVGCIPPESLRAGTIAVPVAPRAARLTHTLASLAAARGMPPALPPPRA